MLRPSEKAAVVLSDGLHSGKQHSNTARYQHKLHRAFEQSRAADEV
ncbi:hypothetical protein HMPREF9120_02097 [Neisseria sp. oral taxon 020 str. F0370]|nr:hypothetical protein HMPREF9120_02097 [Neisseria sp. oral taxon 020 str. F0370]